MAADTLTQLKYALQARDKTRQQARQLEEAAAATSAGSEDKRLQSRRQQQAERLEGIDRKIVRLREAIARESERSRSIASSAEAALQTLESQRGSSDTPTKGFAAEEQSLRNRVTEAEARIDIRNRALLAESAKDLDWLSSVPAAHRATEAPQTTDAQGRPEMRITDWPGTSVPERIMALWRESKKPQSRRSIITSTIIVASLSLIVTAVILISGAGKHRSIEDYLVEGDVLVPILVEDMEGVRNLDFTLEYDAGLVTGVSLIQAEVGRLSVMEYDIDSDGVLEVHIRDVMGISGTGTILTARFKRVDSASEMASLEFTSLSATDVNTMLEIPVQGRDGSIDTATLDVVPAVLFFPGT